MKKILILFVISILIANCSNEDNTEKVPSQKSLDMEVAFNNTIGFVDSETKDFIVINEDQLYSYWKKVVDISKKMSFEGVMISKAIVDEGDEEYYILYSISKDGKTKVASKAHLTIHGLTLDGETCKCETEECSWSGCEVISICACSSCSGKCKKTHTKPGNTTMGDFVLL